MPLFLVTLVVVAITVFVSVKVTGKSNSKWLISRGVDCVVFITTFISFIFSIGIVVRIALYADEYNSSVTAVSGGLIMNLSFFFVPGLLFVSSLILGIRLIRRPTNE